MIARISSLLLLLAVGCRSSDRSEPIGVQTQATLDSRAADDVFGQLDLFSAIKSSVVERTSLSAPIAVAADPQFRAGANIYFVLDRDYNRALAISGLSFTTANWALGQRNFVEVLPNSGAAAVNSAGFDHPTAIAVGGISAFSSGITYALVADTNNNRVLLGSGFFSSPWFASSVFGQRGDFGTNAPNIGGLDAQTMSGPRGVAYALDSSSGLDHIYVADSGNHRILGFSFGSKSADILFGQADFTSGMANRGGSAGKDTLSSPTGIGYDGRAIYVADTANNRVLRFIAGSETANQVVGQPDFVSTTANNGGIGAATLSAPLAVAPDRFGGIFVADTGNHRVLHFPASTGTADAVYGQPDFTTAAAPPPTPTSMHSPSGVAVTSDGDLLVADTGNLRLLRFAVGCGAGCDDGNPCTDDTCSPGGGCVHQSQVFSRDCAPYRCDLGSLSCVSTCASVSDCDNPTRSQCRNGRCVRLCANSIECPSGFCVDGICCDGACDGPCESCHRSGFEGRCVPLPAGLPERACPLTISGECGTRCDGTRGDRCDPAPAGAPCGVEACTDGEQTTRGSCNGAGACIATIDSCAPYACGSGGCLHDCAYDYQCASGARCVEGACRQSFGGESAGGGCAFGHPGRAGSLFALALALAAVMARRRRR